MSAPALAGRNSEIFLDLITTVWLGSIGACIGSFLNVVAFRMPRGASIVWMPSQCPACRYPIRFRDNLPILGWLSLRGRCRDCGIAISPRYVLVEAAMSVAFMLLATIEMFSGGANLPGGPITGYTGAWGTIWHVDWSLVALYAYHCGMLSVLMVAALVDLDYQRVPFKLAVVAAVAVVAAATAGEFLYPDSPLWAARFGRRALVDASAGGATLAGVAIVVALCAPASNWRDRLILTANGSFAMGIAGACCGFRAALTIALMTLAIFAVASRIHPPLCERRQLWLPCLWIAALLQVLCWRLIVAAVPWGAL